MKRALPLLLLAACGSSDTFPKGFLFGTAIAGFQADMGCPTLPASQCEDPNSDWYAFITQTPSDLQSDFSTDPPDAGPGDWELFSQDLQLAANDLHTNAYRLSIEWSRIFPTATDSLTTYDQLKAAANPAALAHYHAIFQQLKQLGISPLVTLNHYTLPTWIHDAIGCHQNLQTCSPRGWVDDTRTVNEIAKYAGFCAQEFGGEVDRWATLNEPTAVILPGYIAPSADRANPPAVLLALTEAHTAWNAMIDAHARMYDAIKANDTVDADGDGIAAEVGIVYSMAPVAPADPNNPTDVRAADNFSYLANVAFLQSVATGNFDANLDRQTTLRPDLAGRMDYIGINYYYRITVQGTPDAQLPQFSPLTNINITNIQTGETYPHGIYEMIQLAAPMGPPIIITENGAQDPNDDGTAPQYLTEHLTWVSRAIHDKFDVRGYFYWTLMDNYEWNHGMSYKFGLYAVDKNDPQKTRVARQAVSTYAEIIHAGQIPSSLAKLYPQ